MTESAKQHAAARRQREQEAREVVEDIKLDRRRRDGRIGIALLITGVVLAVASQFLYDQTAAPEATTPVALATDVPNPDISEYREWTGSITLNDSVNLEVTLAGDLAPQATANFISLARSGFYQDVSCHRLTTDGLYVLQCGDPTGTGSGGPGYAFGPLENVPADGVYPAGTIAMARTQDPNSMGSQFFIVYQDTELPSPGYTVFGQVTGGLDDLKQRVVDAGVAAGSASDTDGAPATPVTITAIELQ